MRRQTDRAPGRNGLVGAARIYFRVLPIMRPFLSFVCSPFRFGLLLLCAGMGVRLAAAEPAGPLHLAFPDPRVVVNGLPWFPEESPVLRRLPTKWQATFPPKVWNLAQDPSGGRLRFVTDSQKITLVAEGFAGPAPAHMTAIANAGIDLYVDGVFFGAAAPDKNGLLRKEWITGRDRRPRELTIYLPLTRPIAIKEIILEGDATLAPPRPFALEKPVVYYGSSITQGIAASNPGDTFEALLSRWLDVDFVNLGFSGNGLGEPALAQAVAAVDAACYVVDYWANPTTAVYRETLPKFVAILREQHPTTPIIVTGPYYNPSEEIPGEAGARQIEKRVVAREFVAARRAAGDTAIFHVDGLEMLAKDQADGLVDGRHANSMGFYFCARGLEPTLREALRLPARDVPRK